jgi:prepilin-type N-terminal cleavage/methylation domain-containing protein
MNLPEHSTARRGFTLLELLVVMAIIIVLSILTIPNLASLLGGENMTRNLAQLSDTLEVAREYATANNTYVWIAFYPNTGSNGINTLTVAVFASNDGTDPASTTSTPWGNAACSYGLVPSSEISLISKMTTLKQISLLNAASFPIGTLPATPAVSASVNSVATTPGGLFTARVPGGTTVNFTQAIEFLPSGQARNSSSPTNVIDLDIQPQTGTTAQSQNVAVLRINGLTGQTVIYRP